MSLGLCDAVGEKEAKDNYRRKELRADPTEVPLCLCRCGDTLTWLGGSSSAVERQLPKLDVTGSIPVSRSRFSSLIFQLRRGRGNQAHGHGRRTGDRVGADSASGAIAASGNVQDGDVHIPVLIDSVDEDLEKPDDRNLAGTDSVDRVGH